MKNSIYLNLSYIQAAFWATNPNNTWQHNAVAGATHFGYWYRILDKPDGPSFTTSYCPRKIPLGKFFNNSVHSVGRFGLWIFPGYTPTPTGSCSDNNPGTAKFEYFTAYGCDKGAEWVDSSGIQFRNFIVYDHATTGIEAKSITSHASPNTPYSVVFYNESTGPLIADSVIIGNSNPNAVSSLTPRALTVPWNRGLLVKNIKFINFFQTPAIGATSIIGQCL